ncbi:TIGR04063 family PEP-CTERM/XrtA system glycosyltransferase [Alterisphingorhabdus coralli]
MRILHILDHSLPLHSGYCFRTRAIMKAQIAAGLAVAGLTGVRHNRSVAEAGAPPAHEVIDGLDFYRTAGDVSGPSPLREWRETQMLAERIVEKVQTWRPDVLHAHSPALNGLAALRAARQCELPLVYEIRAFWEDAAIGNGTGSRTSARYWLTRQLENHVIAGADAVAVICDGLRRDLLARGVIAPSDLVVVPNGVDMALFGKAPPRDHALADALALDAGGEQRPVIGFIGSFYDYEGLDDLIAAMPYLAERHPEAQLLLVGGGPMEAKLRAQAEASPVAANIHFAGRVPHEEVERYYSLIDILAYPRKAMRLTDLVTPLKPLEAMAQNRLVAASDVGGHKELIDHGKTGTLFNADDPQDCAQALGDLLDNRAAWSERKWHARTFVEEKRNWYSNIERYLPVYRKLLGQTEEQGLEQAA